MEGVLANVEGQDLTFSSAHAFDLLTVKSQLRSCAVYCPNRIEVVASAKPAKHGYCWLSGGESVGSSCASLHGSRHEILDENLDGILQAQVCSMPVGDDCSAGHYHVCFEYFCGAGAEIRSIQLIIYYCSSTYYDGLVIQFDYDVCS